MSLVQTTNFSQAVSQGNIPSSTNRRTQPLLKEWDKCLLQLQVQSMQSPRNKHHQFTEKLTTQSQSTNEGFK